MATARCYTKSGNVEKYESNLWQHPGYLNWSGGVRGTITTPDSNGNYTVTPAKGYKDSNSNISTGFYCYTMYNNVKKTFYFIKDTPSYTTVTFRLSSINTSGYICINCSQSGPLSTDVTCTIERISGNGIKCRYSLVYEKSNRMGGFQEFHVTDKPSRDDVYTIKSVYPTTFGNMKYEGYSLGIPVH